MSHSTITVIIGRIKTATSASPIVVFKTLEGSLFNAVFHSTVETISAIENNDPDYMGSYFGETGAKNFRADAYGSSSPA